MTIRSKITSIIISLMVAVTFVPITGQFAFADEAQDVFNTAGKVTGLRQSSATYKSATISWSAYSKAQGYEVYRANKKGGKYKRIKTLTGRSFKDNGNKKLGKKKYYKVRAYATVGGVKRYSAYSGILSAKPKVGTPGGLSTSGSTGSVTIKWKKVSGATGYQVYRATSRYGKYYRLGTTKKKSYTNTSLSKGKKYFYKVRAYKKYHGKKYGSFTSPIEGITRPVGAGGFSTVLASDGTVTSKWSKVKGASGYQLQRAKTAKGSYVTVGETTATTRTDKLTESGQYYYRVRAYSVVNGKRLYGDYSAGGRTNAVNQARSWVGCKESNRSHRKIIDVYNNYGPKYGKIGYGTSWCAAFVSAVAIKTNNTGIIPVDCYCPRMLDNFAKKTRSKSYTPQGGDVVFFDWNWNKVPDHVGMVESVSGKSVTTIEGNYSDAVKRRTFKKGYSLLLAYALPNYSVNNVVSYTAPEVDEDEVITDASVTTEDIEKACEEITATPEAKAEEPSAETAEPAAEEATAEQTEPAEQTADQTEQDTEAAVKAASADEETDAAAEAAEADTEEAAEPAEETEQAAEPAAEDADAATEGDIEAVAAEPLTETETAEKIVEYIQEETPAETADAEESKYNAFLVYGICDELDIDASVVTVTEADGSESSYNEVVLDGELYILNATEDGGVLEKYTPEEIN